ncbi:uncharacterized protein MONBRDRAFT_35489 [Monosiga brevicollis MX1]|uniref:Uncharacterized protein n=1 Tax=Monosiga brevicollis TaxID=81824 RepID=A9UPE9_MONBE|nr:uncharacterized protein MONBRDRAFT_35489 [Monosiga brevicollis MX1]EDQ92409.1 predicted protein [Monosiga brevicollis MX1]|eukprot:XP_001742171.1 hypothetical protein [Monosiga brevicollis MX1]
MADLALEDGVVEVELDRDPELGFGFSIAGGVYDDHGQSVPVVISKVKEGGPADRSGKFVVGSRVVSINGNKTDGVMHDVVVNLLRLAGTHLKLRLKETRIDWSIAAAPTAGASAHLPVRNDAAARIHLPVAFERVQMLYNFNGRSNDELVVKKGDIIHVQGRSADGWCTGECQRTGQSGLFPATYAMRLRHDPRVIESIYSDLETYQSLGSVSGSDSLYEHLPEEQQLSPSPQASHTDYGVSLAATPDLSDGDGHYSRVPARRSTAAGNHIDVLYASVDRKALVVNGDVYSAVQRGGDDPVYSRLSAADEEHYASLSRHRRSISIRPDDAPYAHFPGDKAEVLYEGLPEEKIVTSNDAPPIPERRYDVEEMMKPMIELTIDEGAPTDAEDYEQLPNDLPRAQAQEDLYEDLPELTSEAKPAAPALPDRPSARGSSPLPPPSQDPSPSSGSDFPPPEALNKSAQRSLRKQEEKDRKQKEKERKKAEKQYNKELKLLERQRRKTERQARKRQGKPDRPSVDSTASGAMTPSSSATSNRGTPIPPPSP